ncbi:MAG: type II toxin-antitoxin system HicA family toxin [Candidatus Sungiibacteriota bacterium]
MSIIPILTPAHMLAILLRTGFKIIRQKGSHIRLAHPITGRATTIAMHAKDFSRDLMMKILKQAGISIKDFLALLKKI